MLPFEDVGFWEEGNLEEVFVFGFELLSRGSVEEDGLGFWGLEELESGIETEPPDSPVEESPVPFKTEDDDSLPDSS